MEVHTHFSGGQASYLFQGNIELETTISFDPNFSATSILHPATYLNKVVVASSQGSMQLWNTRTAQVPFN